MVRSESCSSTHRDYTDSIVVLQTVAGGKVRPRRRTPRKLVHSRLTVQHQEGTLEKSRPVGQITYVDHVETIPTVVERQFVLEMTRHLVRNTHVKERRISYRLATPAKPSG